MIARAIEARNEELQEQIETQRMKQMRSEHMQRTERSEVRYGGQGRGGERRTPDKAGSGGWWERARAARRGAKGDTTAEGGGAGQHRTQSERRHEPRGDDGEITEAS